MKVAVACDGLSIAAHFNQSSSYMCYIAEGGTVVDSHNIPVFDQPVEKLAEFFRVIGADTLLTGIIDEGIAKHLESFGVKVVPGVSGDPLTAVRAYLR